MPTLKLAVAGAGLIGRNHMALIQANPRCQLVALVDPAPSAQQVAHSTNVPCYTSLDELFSHHRLDGVILATPNALHVEQALQCLEANVPALIEKPVAHTVAEGERLLAAVQRHHVPMLVGHHRAHSPLLAQARTLIQQGCLGQLVAVMGSALFFKPDSYFDDAPWRRQAGGGPILINLIHEIGNLRTLCGEIVAVQAQASHARRDLPVEDTVAINLRFANGTLGTFMLSDTAASARSWEQTSQENKDYTSYDDEDCYVIVGDQGSLSVPTMRLKTYDTPADRSWWKPFTCKTVSVEHSDPLAHQLTHFCDVMEGRATPLVSVADGLQNLRIVEAIALAARTGQTVSTMT